MQVSLKVKYPFFLSSIWGWQRLTYGSTTRASLVEVLTSSTADTPRTPIRAYTALDHARPVRRRLDCAGLDCAASGSAPSFASGFGSRALRWASVRDSDVLTDSREQQYFRGKSTGVLPLPWSSSLRYFSGSTKCSTEGLVSPRFRNV